MKYIIFLVLISIVWGEITGASEGILGGVEPSEEVLGAPIYPKAVFIRTIPCLDPSYKRVIYVVPDPVGEVKTLFSKSLPLSRVVQYREDNVWVWAFLLKERTPIPDKPTRDELTLLDRYPNIQVTKFNEELYDPIIELLEMKKAHKKLEALKNAHTIIRYTYEVVEQEISSKKIIGKWKNADRDLHVYTGSVLQFQPDGTYIHTLTSDNITYLAKMMSSEKDFEDMTLDDIKRYIEKRNPERGTFSILRNTINIVTDSALIGERQKSGLAEVGSVSLSLLFIGTPRLTFIRLPSE